MAFTPTDEQKKVAKEVWDVLLSFNYSKESASGVIGNLHAESGMDPNVNEDGGGGYGLGQWTPKSNLYAQAQLLGISNAEAETAKGQAKIIAQGDVTGQWAVYSDTRYHPTVVSPMTLDEFKKLKDRISATSNFCSHWERPSLEHARMAERFEATEVYWEILKDGGSSGGDQICYEAPIKDTNMNKDSFMPEQLYGFSESRPNNFHNGLDFGSIDHPGNDMIAMCDGEIVTIGDGNVGGLYVWYVLRDPNFDIHYWESASSLSDMVVSVGQKVKKGDVLSHRTRDHLHISITKNRDYMAVMSKIYIDDGTWIDPMTVIGSCFGGGVEPPKKVNEFIHLLLCDAVNGWKY